MYFITRILTFCRVVFTTSGEEAAMIPQHFICTAFNSAVYSGQQYTCTELHSGVQSAISAGEPEPAVSDAYIYECNRCAIKSNQNKMDTGLREREHLLTLKGRYSAGFVLIVFDVSLCFFL